MVEKKRLQLCKCASFPVNDAQHCFFLKKNSRKRRNSPIMWVVIHGQISGKSIGGSLVEGEPATVDDMEDMPHLIGNHSFFQAVDNASAQHLSSNRALMPTGEDRGEY